MPGVLYLVSGPSGSGKTTLCRRLANDGLAVYAISATTRAPRNGEEHGKDYYFLTREDFSAQISAGDFIEHAEVHGNHYGTLKSEVIGHLEQNACVVLDIDVQGAAQVRACDDPIIREALLDLFIMPETEEELLKRLTGRGTDSEDVIALRMTNALEEITHKEHYSHHLLSRTHEEDYEKFRNLLSSRRQNSSS